MPSSIACEIVRCPITREASTGELWFDDVSVGTCDGTDSVTAPNLMIFGTDSAWVTSDASSEEYYIDNVRIADEACE